MSNNIVIQVDQLGKQYRLGEIGTGTLAGDFKNILKRISGRQTAESIAENDRTKSASKGDIVWAVKDISFNVKQGEVVGIIGRNGAGKSTLLKMLSRVTAPSTGHIKVKGRIASLLEVGTGFHPELTGRENIYLNGAILGMTKKEIKSKFDEIVDFSGVARYIDTPVKRYSSGMYVRLAFAVAAHLEPEILIVDEVLAVGDVEFQRKCLGKMKDVSGQGRTVIFVSHNMGAVKSLCDRGILIQNGVMAFDGHVDECINQYLQVNRSGEAEGMINIEQKGTGSGEALIKRIEIINHEQNISETVLYKAPIKVGLHIDAHEDIPMLSADVKICDRNGTVLFHALNLYEQQSLHLNKGNNVIQAEITNNLLPGEYFMSVGIHNAKNYHTIDFHENIIMFTIEKAALISAESYPYEWVVAPALAKSEWKKIN